MNDTLLPAYAEKGFGYYENERAELLGFVPPGVRRVLDVGCGAGRFAERLRRERGCEVWGIEPDTRIAPLARPRVAHLEVALFTPTLPLPAAHFDLICFNDVLEHMPQPELALQYARSLLAPSGRVLASVPNFRHFNNLWELVVHGRADYRESGVMDKTHLRIFTRHSVQKLFREQGYVIERAAGISPQFTRRLFHLFNCITLGRISDMRWLQIAVVAKSSTSTPAGASREDLGST